MGLRGSWAPPTAGREPSSAPALPPRPGRPGAALPGRPSTAPVPPSPRWTHTGVKTRSQEPGRGPGPRAGWAEAPWSRCCGRTWWPVVRVWVARHLWVGTPAGQRADSAGRLPAQQGLLPILAKWGGRGVCRCEEGMSSGSLEVCKADGCNSLPIISNLHPQTPPRLNGWRVGRGPGPGGARLASRPP